MILWRNIDFTSDTELTKPITRDSISYNNRHDIDLQEIIVDQFIHLYAPFHTHSDLMDKVIIINVNMPGFDTLT